MSQLRTLLISTALVYIYVGPKTARYTISLTIPLKSVSNFHMFFMLCISLLVSNRDTGLARAEAIKD